MRYPLPEVVLPMGGTFQKNEKKMEALWNDPNYVAEEKFDGSRYLSIDGRFFSRVVSVKDGFPVEKTENVPHLASHLSKFHGLILDGEIYRPGATSNEVTSIMGAKPELAVQRQEEQGYLLYVVYDILMADGEWVIDKTWTERRTLLEDVYRKVSNPHIQLSRPVYENKWAFLQEVLERGGEGVMLKNVHGKYVPGKKPANNWVKVKTQIDDDVIITGFKPAVRDYEGKEIDSWQYWEDEEGTKYLLNGKSHAEKVGEVQKIRLTPVTKFHFYGWIGAIKFGKFYPIYRDADGQEFSHKQVEEFYANALREGSSFSFEEFVNLNYRRELCLKELGECSGITEELRKEMSECPDDYIGTVMEIKAMQKTKDGFYRHPQFSRLRSDKGATECLLDEY